MAPRVLISDKLSPRAAEIFQERGVETEIKTGLDRDQLIEIIPQYDGLAVRSASKVTEKVIAAADNLKVIGRAGIGVDNIDVTAASGKGIIVMNTPFGNSITTAEHAISLMLALARQIPAANRIHAGRQVGEDPASWEWRLYGKTLGVIGCGNIGAIVADRGDRPAQ